MTGTAMLDVLTNAIGAMLASALLFLILIGYPKPIEHRDDLENPVSVSLFLKTSLRDIPTKDRGQLSPINFLTKAGNSGDCNPTPSVFKSRQRLGCDAAANNPTNITISALLPFVGCPIRNGQASDCGEQEFERVIFAPNITSTCILIDVHAISYETGSFKTTVEVTSWVSGYAPFRKDWTNANNKYFTRYSFLPPPNYQSNSVSDSTVRASIAPEHIQSDISAYAHSVAISESGLEEAANRCPDLNELRRN